MPGTSPRLSVGLEPAARSAPPAPRVRARTPERRAGVDPGASSRPRRGCGSCHRCRRSVLRLSTTRAPSSPATFLRRAFIAWPGPCCREELLAHPHRPERQRLAGGQAPALDTQRLDAPAAYVESEPVLDRRRVGDREIAVVSLLASGDHPRVEPGALVDGAQQLLTVAGVADRTRGHGLHLLDVQARQKDLRRPYAGRDRSARAAARPRHPCRR